MKVALHMVQCAGAAIALAGCSAKVLSPSPADRLRRQNAELTAKVESLEPASAISARFSDGTTEEFDLVIQATGVRPKFAEKLADQGIRLGAEVFSPDAGERKAVSRL